MLFPFTDLKKEEHSISGQNDQHNIAVENRIAARVVFKKNMPIAKRARQNLISWLFIKTQPEDDSNLIQAQSNQPKKLHQS